ncbi:unnamed protein product [Gadus morhua 'NCC']
MVKPQSQHSGGRGVEQAGCSYAGDGEASWTAPGVSSSLAGQQYSSEGETENVAGTGLRLKKALAWADSVCATSSCRRARAVRRTAAMAVSAAPCRETCAEEQEASSSVWEASPSVITSLKSSASLATLSTQGRRLQSMQALSTTQERSKVTSAQSVQQHQTELIKTPTTRRRLSHITTTDATGSLVCDTRRGRGEGQTGSVVKVERKGSAFVQRSFEEFHKLHCKLRLICRASPAVL